MKRLVTLFLVLTLIIPTIALASSNITSVMITKNPNDKAQIKAIIDKYFKIKYESFKSLKIQDFSNLLTNTEKANKFLKAENDKREIEIYNAKINELRYVDYKYFLEFKDIKINKKENIAVVKVIEGHDVIFECHPDITSKMRNLEHTITLIKTDDGWEIENDIFFDTKRAGIEASIEAGLSKEEIMEKLKLQKKEEEEAIALNQNTKEPSEEIVASEGKPDGIITPLSGTWHSYNRTAAVNYAYKYWKYPGNTSYHYFTFSEGGDCTNFASQVIHAGGAPMDKTGSYQWYYNGYYTPGGWSPSWTDVNHLYNYLTNNWWTGPVGKSTTIYGVSKGDLVNLKRYGNSSYSHCPIIVKIYYPRSPSNILVATHSYDHIDYPLSNWGSYTMRYVRITEYYD